MAAPVWVTESGSLGVVPEGKFYRISLQAEDPDFPTDATKVIYSLVAGALPSGVQISTNGTIEGIPVSVADFKGVPSEVATNTTSKFAIRVRSVDDPTLIVDRTFTLTVSGQDKPVWVTPAGNIGTWTEGTEVNFQFDAYDLDPGDTITIALVAGTLPAGLTLSLSGLLSGFVTPLVPPGISQHHEFTLRLSDSKDVVLRTFDLDISSQSVRPPYISNNVPDLGRFRHDNYFAHKFDGQDPDGDEIRYNLVSSNAISLQLDTATGWLYGYLPDIGFTEEVYNVSVDVYKVINPAVRSSIYETSITLSGNIDTEVTWVTDSNLGMIDNGSTSMFTISAKHSTATLQYRLAKGGYFFAGYPSAVTSEYTDDTLLVSADTATNTPGIPICSKLPQGLKLLPSGNIVGQVSFKTFSLDGGSTTFNEDDATRLSAAPTTFDLTFTFTVEAYNDEKGISAKNEFTIVVNREYDVPHTPIYCKAMPPVADRDLIDALLLNLTVLPAGTLYRADDPNFGVAKHVIYNHAYGLSPSTASDYLKAIELNHYNKNLVLGEIKTARALDSNENVLYEVVYSQVIDTLVNATGESVSASVDLNYPAIDNGQTVREVYPNSLFNMSTAVIDELSRSSKVLPIWMLSKQEDGTVPGFTPAWVIAYTVPGKSKLVQYNIDEFFGTQLNLIDFEIDRYTLDAALIENWEKITVDAGDITVDSKVAVNDPGHWLDGQTTITADSVDTTADSTIIINAPSRRTGGAETTFNRAIAETIFDGGCTQFISPVDIYDDTDSKDKYIKFPRTQIINNKL